MRTAMRSGFTTLETISVVVVFSVIAAIAGPKFYAQYAAVTTRTSADRLVRASEMARATAVRFGRDAELRIDTTTKTFWVQVDTSANLSGVKDTIGIVNDLTGTKVGMTMKVSGSNAATAVVCFDVRGLRSSRSPCQGGDVAVYFRLDTHVDTTAVTSLGKVLR
jgi:Tfp pilus assembly protein FimT